MSIALLNLLKLSFSASFIIVVILILRLIFKNAPRLIFCILYGIVAIRLIFPFSVESNFSLIPKTDNIENEIIQNTFSNNNFSIIQNNQSNEEIPDLNMNNTDNINNNLTFTESENDFFIVDIIYLSVTVLILLYGVISYVRLKNQIVASKKIKNSYYICDNIQVPFILGIIKPKIYVPSELKDPELSFVLCHEKAHIKRFDNIWKPLGYILLSIYWFNPLIWIAYIMFCKDIEIAADEKVIKELGEDSKKSYSETLLSYSTKNQKLVTACPVAFGEIGVKERIKSILNYKKPTVIIIVIAIVLCIVIAICFLTSPMTDINNAENLSRDEIVNIQSEVDNGHYPWRVNAEETALEFIQNKYGNVEINKVDTKYINSKKAIITINYDNNDYTVMLFKPIEKGNNGIWVVKECEVSMQNDNNIEVSETFKSVLERKRKFYFS